MSGEPRTPRPCSVYRFFNKSGDLLYVGKTINLASRWTDHGMRDWRKLVTRIELENFEYEDDALRAEAKAIRDEKPKYNRVYNEEALKEQQERLQAELDLDVEAILKVQDAPSPQPVSPLVQDSPALNTTQAAAFVGLNPGTLANMRSRKAGPKYVLLATAVRYRVCDLSEWLAENVVDPKEDTIAEYQTRVRALTEQVRRVKTNA